MFYWLRVSHLRSKFVLCIYIYDLNVDLLKLMLHLLPHVVAPCFTYADDDDDLQTDLSV